MLASKGERLANLILDIVIIGLATIIISIIVSLITPLYYFELAPKIYVFVHLFYYIYYEYRFEATIGKRVTGTRVVRKDGKKLTMLNVFSRTILRFIKIDAFSFVYGSEIGFHDAMSGTIVIKRRVRQN